MPQGPYRCANCVDKPERCAECRERRRLVVAKLRDERRKAGLCHVCGDPPDKGPDGKPLTRCKRHRKQNAKNSLASHKRGRK